MEGLFDSETEQYRTICNGMQRRYSLAHPMSEFLGTMAVAIVLWYGGTLILGGDTSIDAPGFIYYMVIFYSIINPAKEPVEGVIFHSEGYGVVETYRPDS